MVGGYFTVGLLVSVLFNSCISEKSLSEQEEKVFIYVDGHPIELVSDEYGNQYLREKTACGVVFIPFTFHKMLMEEEYRQWLTKERNRKPALIKVIDKDKILEHEKLKYHILPF